MFDGGYVDLSGDEPRYCWYTKGHLGSVRAVANAEGKVFANYDYGPYGEDFVAERAVASNVQEGVLGAQLADVPAYGGEITYVGQLRPGMSLPATTPAVTYTANESPDWQPYKFSGKESLTRVGLELYDFGARMYSPTTMRWTTMDPLCEKYYSISPYAYCSCDPINRVDQDGMVEWKLVGKGAIATIGGVAAAVTGAVAAPETLGASAALIQLGVTTAGLGIASMAVGFAVDKDSVSDEERDILTSSPTELVGKALDKGMGNETPYCEITANVLEVGIGLSTGLPNSVTGAISMVYTGVQAKTTVDSIKDAVSSTNKKNGDTNSANSKENKMIRPSHQLRQRMPRKALLKRI